MSGVLKDLWRSKSVEIALIGYHAAVEHARVRVGLGCEMWVSGEEVRVVSSSCCVVVGDFVDKWKFFIFGFFF